MVKSRILRATGVALTSVGLVAALGGGGLVGASSGSVSDTGPYSTNKVLSIFKNHVDVSNDNHVSLMNDNSQAAASGSATVSENTTGGGAKTGSASTTNSTMATLTLKNSMPSMGGMGGGSTSGTIHETGPYSDNKVVFVTKNHVDVTNDNSICLVNTNEQAATSGDATVSDNTTGGGATTGSASTSNSSSFSVSISN